MIWLDHIIKKIMNSKNLANGYYAGEKWSSSDQERMVKEAWIKGFEYCKRNQNHINESNHKEEDVIVELLKKFFNIKK